MQRVRRARAHKEPKRPHKSATAGQTLIGLRSYARRNLSPQATGRNLSPQAIGRQCKALGCAGTSARLPEEPGTCENWPKKSGRLLEVLEWPKIGQKRPQ